MICLTEKRLPIKDIVDALPIEYIKIFYNCSFESITIQIPFRNKEKQGTDEMKKDLGLVQAVYPMPVLMAAAYAVKREQIPRRNLQISPSPRVIPLCLGSIRIPR